MSRAAMLRPLYAVVERELLKLVRQRGRLVAQMLRPLLWLFVIGSGFGALMARHGAADYQRYLVPGVLGMTILFGAMLGALSTVYDKESGVMRLLVIAPVSHVWVVVAKTVAAAVGAIVQGALLAVLLAALGYIGADIRLVLLVGGMIATAFTCAALGMLVATHSRTLENYAVIMNVVIFPVYFVSGSLYPIDLLPDYLKLAAMVNPFSYGVDIIKHAMFTSPQAGFGHPEFGLATDLAAVAGFSIGALVVASVRFAGGSACEALVHPQIGRAGRRR